MSALLMFLLPNLLDWMVKGLDRALAALIRNAVVGFGGSLSVAQWNVAIGVANRLGWVMGFVNMALCALGAVAGAVRARPAESLKSFAMAFLAWPVTAAVISMVIPLQGVVGQLTARVMDSAAGEGADAASGSYIMSFVSLMFAPLGGIAWLLRVVLYLVLVIGAVGLALSMSMCSLSMILLVGVAPVPLMTLGWSASRRVMTKWVQAFLGVLLAPLCTALIIYVGGALMNSSASGLEGLWNTLVGLAAILMGIYSPRLLMPAVSFIGDNVTARLQDGAAAAGRGAVTGAVRAAADVTREVVRIAAAGFWVVPRARRPRRRATPVSATRRAACWEDCSRGRPTGRPGRLERTRARMPARPARSLGRIPSEAGAPSSGTGACRRFLPRIFRPRRTRHRFLWGRVRMGRNPARTDQSWRGGPRTPLLGPGSRRYRDRAAFRARRGFRERRDPAARAVPVARAVPASPARRDTRAAMDCRGRMGARVPPRRYRHEGRWSGDARPHGRARFGILEDACPSMMVVRGPAWCRRRRSAG